LRDEGEREGERGSDKAEMRRAVVGQYYLVSGISPKKCKSGTHLNATRERRCDAERERKLRDEGEREGERRGRGEKDCGRQYYLVSGISPKKCKSGTHLNATRERRCDAERERKLRDEGEREGERRGRGEKDCGRQYYLVSWISPKKCKRGTHLNASSKETKIDGEVRERG
jgi:hypothetical protein